MTHNLADIVSGLIFRPILVRKRVMKASIAASIILIALSMDQAIATRSITAVAAILTPSLTTMAPVDRTPTLSRQRRKLPVPIVFCNVSTGETIAVTVSVRHC